MAGNGPRETSFANIVAATNDTPNTAEGYGSAKPIFLMEKDIFGLIQPQKKDWLTHQELYKAIGEKVEANHVCGLQRTGKMRRIYVDNMADRTKLLTTGIVIRKKMVQLISTNPRRPDNNHEYTSRVRVSNVPLSADDGEIKRALTLLNCNIKSMYREKLRIDNQLTNCDTGNRIVITEKLTTPPQKHENRKI
ncbi:uncharacterized protein [Argopecten irradians]|uniref:uncharacterized protein n=1 Tax=Argopecten irradians TaxID=31199 RepID=UPI00371B7ECC